MRRRSQPRARAGRFAAGNGSSPLKDELGEQLAGWGVVIRLETRGRVSRRPVEVALGYVEEPDGSLLIAAGSPNADWARNLDADPRCRVRIGDGVWRDSVAESLEGSAAQRVVRELILKYGTPAERLGHGPAFRVRPTSAPVT